MDNELERVLELYQSGKILDLEALFQRDEDIDNLAAAAFGSRRRNCDLLSLYFLVDHRQKPLAVLVVILFRLELVG